MKYKVVESNFATELAESVTKWAARGWVPQGGVQVIQHDFEYDKYFQAMILPTG